MGLTNSTGDLFSGCYVDDLVSASEILKVDEALGLVLGFAIVSKENGADHYDLQGHHIPEDVMLKGAAEFAASDRVSLDMHDPEGKVTGQVLFMFPLTTDVAKAFFGEDFEPKKTGLMIGMKPNNAETLRKFATGEFKGFSIGGKGQLMEVAA